MFARLAALYAAEPLVVNTAVGTLVDGLVVLGVTFGLPITEAQKKAADGVVVALGILATLFLSRSQVTPSASSAPAVKVAP